jgi:hypothetical protein
MIEVREADVTGGESGSGALSRAWTRREVDGRGYLRLAVRTRWLSPGDDLAAVLRAHLPPLRGGDTVIVSEKVAVLLTGRTVPTSQARPRPLARTLARCVRPRPGSRGLSVPEKMQFVVQSVGVPRLLAAAVASAMTRPFGAHGVFYRVAGPLARDIDGGRPPYEHLLFPPLSRADALDLCADLQAAVGAGVAIVDINDFGGTIRAVSSRSLRAPTLARALADNPLQQRSASTPIGVVRPVVDAGRATADVARSRASAPAPEQQADRVA